MTRAMAPDTHVSAESFAQHCNGQMIPVHRSLSYFSVIPLEDSELQRLVYDPAATFPPKIAQILPKLRIVIVKYLEKPRTKESPSGPMVVFRPPTPSRRLGSTVVEQGDESFVFLAIKDEDVADYHDALYREIALLLSRRVNGRFSEGFKTLLKDELVSEARGEIDDASWRIKEKVLQRKGDPTRETKLMQTYSRQALVDTLRLYQHGLCCDIDVESGPRQLGARYIRRRLQFMREQLPPPGGVALFPEEIQSLS